MKAFLAGVLLLPALAVAQQDYVIVEKDVVCAETKKVLESLVTTHKEIPVWMGEESKSRYSLLINEKTGAWTLIQFDQEIACIIGAGDKSKDLLLGPTT